MKVTISDHFIDESLIEKAQWFSAQSFEERIAWLDEWTEIILQNNPRVFEKFGNGEFSNDRSFQGTVRILRKIRG